ncbi:tRNA nucleotidyltransferase/poly(A) polymerase family protein [Bacilliculturomica massiliensis]|uniref:hypothetical protein n=1 Tax=Bacilliculturomica massiliensis TaxID=1917867 RepID=UPI00102FF3B0|nr:hypothetical protein [Bacilliculturomica massiliensis]
MDDIRLPRGIKKILRLLSENKRTAAAAGAGLRELAAETELTQWSVITDADAALLARLFPEGKQVGGSGSSGESEAGMFRLEGFGPEAGDKDAPVVFYFLSGTMEEHLNSRLVTADAFAFDGQQMTDPWGGLEDARAERIRTVRDSGELLKEDPSAAFELIEYAARTGFSLEGELKARITSVASQLKETDKTWLARWFGRILTAPHAGQGVLYIRDCKLFPLIVGERIYRTMSKNEKKGLDMYIRRIDDTLPILERRLTVFYLGFLRKRDFAAMAHLNYDSALREKEIYAHKHLPDLHFIRKSKQLKRLIYDEGFDNYQFLENIAKIQCKLYDIDTKGVFVRDTMLHEISKNNEAVFIEDLAIKKKDLMESGIVKDEKRADLILSLLPYYVHKWPKFNTKEILLDQAKKIQRNKWKEFKLKHAYFRG